MVKICKNLFKDTDGFYMDGYLQSNLDVIIKHSKKDWDWVIIIAGSGKTRIGKTVLGQQIACYLATQLGRTFNLNNFIFRSCDVKKKAYEFEKGNIFLYDEARGGLENKKIMTTVTKDLLDFFSECGYLNHIYLLLLPDYFDLPKEIAISRSVCLINVYYTGEFERGYFSFYNDERKKNLYIKGKKFLNYFAEKPNFRGRFTDFWVIDKEEYIKAKTSCLKEEKIPKNSFDIRNNKTMETFIRYLYLKNKLKPQEIALEVGMSSRNVYNYIEKIKLIAVRNGEDTETP
jgi:hypothetical protein